MDRGGSFCILKLKLLTEFIMLMVCSVKLPDESIDKKGIVCYYVAMINSIKNKYFTYQPGEFLPVYIDGKLANKRDFHIYRIKWIVNNHRAFAHQLTHSRG